jgi:hypothetical protein
MAQSFETFLRAQRQGALLDQITEALAQLVTDVQMTSLPGTLNLILKVEPFKKHGSDVVIVTDDVKVKTPQLPREREVYFVAEDGSLVQEDPKQHKLKLRGVPTEHDEDGVVIESANG